LYHDFFSTTGLQNVGSMRRSAWVLLWGLHYLQAAAAPARPGAQLTAFAGPGAPQARCALRPGSALCGRGAPPPAPRAPRGRAALLPGASSSRRRRVATCALVQGGAEEAQADREVAPPEFKDTIYAQSTAVGMVRAAACVRRAPVPRPGGRSRRGELRYPGGAFCGGHQHGCATARALPRARAAGRRGLTLAREQGGIAVIRVSGPDALPALQRLSKPGAKVPKPRYATLRTIVEPDTQQELDSSLVLFFPGPKSFTGEDVVEIHCHGGIAIVNSVLEALGSCTGLRLAQVHAARAPPPHPPAPTSAWLVPFPPLRARGPAAPRAPRPLMHRVWCSAGSSRSVPT
jgi:hypothetical protein